MNWFIRFFGLHPHRRASDEERNARSTRELIEMIRQDRLHPEYGRRYNDQTSPSNVVAQVRHARAKETAA